MSDLIVHSILKQYDFNLAYARKLTEDVPTDLLARSGGPGLESHPAFTIGHLATGSGLMAETFTGTNDVPTAIRDACERRGPGNPRIAADGPEECP